MKLRDLLTAFGLLSGLAASAQTWSVANAPAFTNRIDDLYMADTHTGYAVGGDGRVVKTTDGGNNWYQIDYDDSVYCRSVEFIDAQKGFIGGFPNYNRPTDNIFRKTTDGGATWTDLTYQLDPRARKGICGLCVADANTIYGCGNWYQDSAYIVKSADGGATWSFIDMHTYASSLIDMCFTSKDTGFATGRGPLPLQTAVILYTTDGGATWTYKFQNTTASEYCWKIQRLTSQVYFASIEDMSNAAPTILKSTDGGMSWNIHQVQSTQYNIEGVGFIDTLRGWAGGDFNNSFESVDGGLTWTQNNICPAMNRVFKVNDTLLFATGFQIWKYAPTPVGIRPVTAKQEKYISVHVHPNPVNDVLSVSITLGHSTHALLGLYDMNGRLIRSIENTERPKGEYQYTCSTADLPAGTYQLLLKTHDDKSCVKVVVRH